MADVFAFITVVPRESFLWQVQEALQLVISHWVTKALFERSCKKFGCTLFYFSSSVRYVTSVFKPVVSKCLIHHISKLHTYRPYSFHYITLGLETIFSAFSRFGVTVS